MGRTNASEKILSKLVDPKTFGFLLLIGLVACNTATKSNPGLDAKNAIRPDLNELNLKSDFINSIENFALPGNNFISDIHEKQKKLLFFSSERLAHNKFQVYELDLKTKKERRVTHQNGHAFHASYHPNNQHIIYSSTTDFEKEDLSKLFEIDESNQDLSFRAQMEKLKSDLFISRLNGTNIIRASFIDTGEQFPQYHPKDYTIVYRLVRDDSSSIEAMTRYRKPIPALSKRDSTRSFLRISKNGKSVAWMEFSKDGKFYLEKMDWKNKKTDRYPLGNLEEVRSLQWVDDETLLLTGRFTDDKFPQLYSLKSDSSCVTKLASAEFGIQSAHTQKDRIYFTAFTGNQWQIYGGTLTKLPVCN